jgi:hypothetical protein
VKVCDDLYEPTARLRIMGTSKKQKVFSSAGIRLYKPLPKETQKTSQGGLIAFRLFALILIFGISFYFY